MDIRLQTVRSLTTAGWTARQIAHHVGVSKESIDKDRLRIRKGITGRKQRNRTVVTSAAVQRVKNILTSGPNGSIRKTAAILTRRGHKIGPTSVYKCAKFAGIAKKRPLRKLRLNQQQLQRRVSYCRRNLRRNWNQTLFVDECSIQLNSRPNPQNEGYWVEKIKMHHPCQGTNIPPKSACLGGFPWLGGLNWSWLTEIWMVRNTATSWATPSKLQPKPCLRSATGHWFKMAYHFIGHSSFCAHWIKTMLGISKKNHIHPIHLS